MTIEEMNVMAQVLSDLTTTAILLLLYIDQTRFYRKERAEFMAFLEHLVLAKHDPETQDD